MKNSNSSNSGKCHLLMQERWKVVIVVIVVIVTDKIKERSNSSNSGNSNSLIKGEK